MTSVTSNCDVLVVGGGMAGLTAAAYLSKSGLKVCLCEKEKKTGESFFSNKGRGYRHQLSVTPSLVRLFIQYLFYNFDCFL